MNVKKSLVFKTIDKWGVASEMQVEYGLVFSEKGKLLKVYNEYHHSIEEQSEVFLKFKNNEKTIFAMAK